MFPQVIIFLLFFCGGSLAVEAPAQLPSCFPALKSGTGRISVDGVKRPF